MLPSHRRPEEIAPPAADARCPRFSSENPTSIPRSGAMSASVAAGPAPAISWSDIRLVRRSARRAAFCRSEQQGLVARLREHVEADLLDTCPVEPAVGQGPWALPPRRSPREWRVLVGITLIYAGLAVPSARGRRAVRLYLPIGPSRAASCNCWARSWPRRSWLFGCPPGAPTAPPSPTECRLHVTLGCYRGQRR